MSRGTQVHAVRVPSQLWERARAAADERGETVSDVIRKMLAAYADGWRVPAELPEILPWDSMESARAAMLAHSLHRKDSRK